ncbi:MAG: FprA family A-type flavoprotein [bacterium]
MKPREVRPGVYWVGAVDWDRRLFDSLIPLPEGTSYNSYLVRGSEKTVLFDTVDPAKTQVLLDNLQGVDRLDHIVIHHVEQDHSGSLPVILARHPEARVLCSPKAIDLLVTHLHVPADALTPVEDGEELSLGDKTLRFLHTPWVHWPETMSTYVAEDRILLSCDFMGSHLATSDLFGREEEVLPAAKRYFAEIMMPFRAAVRKNLDKVEPLGAEVIAPSHGPLYGSPQLIFDAYREWVDDPPHNLVVIPYVTMHGSTLALVERLTAALTERGVKVERFDLSSIDLGRLATSLVDAATIVVGTPTVQTNPHPSMMSALYLAAALRPKVRFLSLVATYGWASNVVETVASLTAGLKAEMIEPVLIKGLPRPEDLTLVDELAATIAAKHSAAGLV